MLAVTGACCVPQQCVYPRKPGLSSPSFLTSNPTVMVSTWALLGLCKEGSYQMGTRGDAPLTANLSRTWVNALGSKGRYKVLPLDTRPRGPLCPCVTVMEVTVPSPGRKVYKGPETRAGRRLEFCSRTSHLLQGGQR